MRISRAEGMRQRRHETLNDDYATALSLEMLFMTLTVKTIQIG